LFAIVDLQSASCLQQPLIVVPPLKALNEQPVVLGLQGEHQKLNAGLAVALAYTWLCAKEGKPLPLQQPTRLPQERVAQFHQGLKDCWWPGRSQIVPLKRAPIYFYLDGAHTAESTQACRAWFAAAVNNDATTKQNNDKKNILRALVFNCAGNRDPSKLLPPLAHHNPFDLVFFTPSKTGITSPTFQDKRDFRSQYEKDRWQSVIMDTWNQLTPTKNPPKLCANAAQVLDQLVAIQAQHPNTEIHVLVTGSLHLVGSFLELLDMQNK
jgi:folylpolyglutamate synthase